ncbi:MAG: hypothetical protein QF596_06175 [Acidimicrobiales bacterium]|jgi:phosphopantetheine adenylyltransferase|nr:hypothetical protein [Acidimicrobiales bacterium]MDP6299075.1 hypothetical protein [Acidimicrobiales bacterium]HJM28155.1 hypothetical protein [Acidimicrobiales bacterium]HJM98543.1 hypothetical protein [Acidimicrobiales bacterium]
MTTAIYPGSFNPPTIGHLEIVQSAVRSLSLTQIDLTISEVALGKESIKGPSLEERVSVVQESLSSIPEAQVVRTSKQLIADIAEGYDVVVLGADKWAQLQDLAFYEDEAHMRDCLRRLPKLAVAPRNNIPVPEEILLEVSEGIAPISSSEVRQGKFEWMTKEAKEYGQANSFWGFS